MSTPLFIIQMKLGDLGWQDVESFADFEDAKRGLKRHENERPWMDFSIIRKGEARSSPEAE